MSYLARVFAAKRQELEAKRAAVPLVEVRARARDAAPPRGFRAALEGADRPVALIAEVKRASPSRGVICGSLDPGAMARVFEAAGAHAVSVLTDRGFFQGSVEDLVTAREAVSLPVIRKDFTVDLYDVYEARAMGADAVLLIVNALAADQLREYREAAESLSMDALVETHSEEEADQALASGATLIGVNNRDLRTFAEAIEASLGVLPRLRGSATLVSESALARAEDVRRVGEAGARAVLIGTALCAAPDPAAKIREVMGW